MRPHHRTAAIALTLVAVIFAVFFRTLESGFLRWDDDINVFENERVQGLTAANLRWMFTDFEQAIRYKPLSWLAWALVHEAFGLNPFGYHLANVLLHCANAVLLFFLLRRLLQCGFRKVECGMESALRLDACAALGTLLWAVHPLRVEPVAWVTGLPYHLALGFALLATLFYLGAYAPDATPAARSRNYWLAVVAFALAVLSYPIVLGYVAALVALDYFPLRRFGEAPAPDPAHTLPLRKTTESETGTQRDGLRRVLIDKLPFLALSLLLVAGTVYGRFHVTGTWDKPVTLDTFTPFARAMQAFYLWAYYAWKPWLPLDLCPVYPVLMESKFTEPVFLLSALGVGVVSIVLFAKRRVWPAAFALWLAHLGLLVPMLGLTERPHYPHDRYSIINGILWSVALSCLMWRLAQARSKTTPVMAVGSALVLLLAGMSYQQTAHWHSDLPFFTDMAANLRSPHYRSQSLLKLGNAHADLGDDTNAATSYREALQLSPSSATFHLHFNLGNAHARLAQWPDAITSYEAALLLKSDSASAHLNYGVALAMRGDLNLAVASLTRALQLNPQSAEAHAQLAAVLTKQGKAEPARQHTAEAERLRNVSQQ